MAFTFDNAKVCPKCPFGGCIEDRRVDRVKGRDTKFRWQQAHAMHCAFEEFVPGSDNDPDPTRTYDTYLAQMRKNTTDAGAILHGASFNISAPAMAKVEGDVFELLEAAALWNAFAAWNKYQEAGAWPSKVFTVPANAVPTPSRKAAAIKLPRGYDTLKLFREEERREVLAMQAALTAADMTLTLSAPDIVGIRLPYPLPPELEIFNSPLDNLSPANQKILEDAHLHLEGKLDGRSFLFALAVKRTTRSDRLYQPLFEANILKFLIEHVLRGASFRFYVHMGSLDGANVEEHYRAASLISLARGGAQRAITATRCATNPTSSAQSVLNDLPLFPL
jgi:hypothetical protein